MTDEEIRRLLGGTRTANLSNAAGNRESLRGLVPLVPDVRACGPAVTVCTAPGDWLKPVEAIDLAEPGAILAIDAGGRPPAVWGELATETCIKWRIAGVVVEGAVQDVADIRDLGFPVWARSFCADAGEPKGEGTINQPIELSGQWIEPGDWVVADADGVIVLPRDVAPEIVLAAREVADEEAQLREQIRAGATLASLIGSSTDPESEPQ